MGQPLTDTPRPTPWVRPLALVLAAAVAVPAAIIPLVPETYRPWGFAAFGAVALFAAELAHGGSRGWETHRLRVPAFRPAASTAYSKDAIPDV